MHEFSSGSANRIMAEIGATLLALCFVLLLFIDFLRDIAWNDTIVLLCYSGVTCMYLYNAAEVRMHVATAQLLVFWYVQSALTYVDGSGIAGIWAWLVSMICHGGVTSLALSDPPINKWVAKNRPALAMISMVVTAVFPIANANLLYIAYEEILLRLFLFFACYVLLLLQVVKLGKDVPPALGVRLLTEYPYLFHASIHALPVLFLLHIGYSLFTMMRRGRAHAADTEDKKSQDPVASA